MITITRESNYADSLIFSDVEAVEYEANGYNSYSNRSDYDTDRAYVASLLDLPERDVLITRAPSGQSTSGSMNEPTKSKEGNNHDHI